MLQPPTYNFDFNEDHKKKIGSTKFVYIAAPSGIGKTFSGDYLETIMGWKHIDGDYPCKNKYLSDHYEDITDRMYANIFEGYHGYMTELARLTLEGAKVSDKVVLTHASFTEPARLLVRQKLIDYGAKPENITMIFLECDRKVHDDAVWKRWNFQADTAGCTVEDYFQIRFGIEGILDFVSFKEKFQNQMMAAFVSPQDSEMPFKVIDVSARDTVFDSIDKALGLENTRPKDLTYEEMQNKIAIIDQERTEKYTAATNAAKATDANTAAEEIEIIKTDPDKYAARRSTLSEFEILDCMHRLSIISGKSADVLASSSNSKDRRQSRQSFILTGKFTIE